MTNLVMTNTGLDKTVSASDVEKYGYCPLSWWLSELNAKENGQELKKGSQDHALIGKDVKNIKSKERLSKESERGILWFSLIAIVIGVNGVAIIYPLYAPSQQGDAIMILLSVIAVLWVIVAALFFYTGLKREWGIKWSRTKPASGDSKMSLPTAVGISEDEDWKKRSTQARSNTFLFIFGSGILALHGFIILFSLGQIHSQNLAKIFLILSLLWLIASSFFYYTSLKKDFDTKEARKTYKIGGGKLSFTDSELSVILFAIVATILASNSLALYHNPTTDIGRILLIVAILWLYGAFIFLYNILRANMRLRMLIDKQYDIVEKRGGVKGVAIKGDLEYNIKEGILEYERGVIWFAMVAIILAFNAIIMNYSKSFEELYGTLIAHIFEIVALIWLLGASFFLYMVLRSSRIAMRLRKEHRIEDGAIEYVDAPDEGSKMLFSEKYGLRGRPDYVLKKDDNLVPVEVKTGRVPRGPLFSHILQLAAYCLLIEEKYEHPPDYGIIRYNDIEHKIEYTDELKNTLISKLDDMRNIMDRDEVHRNHNRSSKCRHCSRREMCPERLT